MDVDRESWRFDVGGGEGGRYNLASRLISRDDDGTRMRRWGWRLIGGLYSVGFASVLGFVKSLRKIGLSSGVGVKI